MPRFRSNLRYILARNFPAHVEFAGIRYFLEIVQQAGDGGACDWVFRANAAGPAQTRSLARSYYGRWHLDGILFSQGFVVQNDSAEGIIMERLQQLGFAASQYARGH